MTCLVFAPRHNISGDQPETAAFTCWTEPTEILTTDLLSFLSRICPAPLTISPRARRPVWARPSAAAAAVARGSRGAPAIRGSLLSRHTPPHTSTARGADPLPPPWARPQAPISPSSRVLALDPSLLPADPLPTAAQQVDSPRDLR